MYASLPQIAPVDKGGAPGTLMTTRKKGREDRAPGDFTGVRVGMGGSLDRVTDDDEEGH